jgi:hypothetical protein
MERFSLRKFKEVESKEKSHVEASNKFASFQDFDAKLEINSE